MGVRGTQPLSHLRCESETCGAVASLLAIDATVQRQTPENLRAFRSLRVALAHPQPVSRGANCVAGGQHAERASILVRRETLRMGLGAANELAWLGSIASNYRSDSRASAFLSAP